MDGTQALFRPHFTARRSEGSADWAGEAALIRVAAAALEPGTPLSAAEQALVARASESVAPASSIVPFKPAELTPAEAGRDALGEAFLRLRPGAERRRLGATYTPPVIIDAMLAWAAREGGAVRRVVDPGAGSGRFLMAAARLFPDAALVGIEIDPLAALLLRANLAVRGFGARARILVGDYREVALPPAEGKEAEGATLFIGNPPYLRHHGIAAPWKQWYAAAAARHGVKASRLAGLHLHFFVRTLELARPGDLGCFVTAAEWLDVNYGASLRRLLAGDLGGVAIHRLDPRALPFAETVTTGAIVCFRPRTPQREIRLRDVSSAAALGDLSGGVAMPAAGFAAARWTERSRPRAALPVGWTELGALCRVHRGQVTGGNDVWIAGAHSAALPARLLFPAVTKARELIAAGDILVGDAHLRRVIDLPPDLDLLEESERAAVHAFLDWAKAQGADGTYIARHRKAWWSVGLRLPAPILCTYMARRAPAFVRNPGGARHINIAHGLYPRAPMSDQELDRLAGWLRAHVAPSAGRTYAGGLTKFEPKELERIAVPPLEALMAASPAG